MRSLALPASFVFTLLAAALPSWGSVDSAVGAAPSAQDLDDPVAELAQRIRSGELTLRYDSVHGYLPALLEELEIPVSSQTLVFSRTSLQTDRIGPWAPRALYFNDDVYLGWVQDSPMIEIAATDPDSGTVFYTVSDADPTRPVIQARSRMCLMCHESRSVTGGPAGLIVLSVLVDRLGYPIGDLHQGSTSERTPHDRRWGGWYVTGTHGEMPHAGNVHAAALSHEVPGADDYAASFDYGPGANVTDLSDRFYTGAYLTPHSDIVALLLLAHQAQVHNLMNLVRSETEAALELEGLRIRGGVETSEEGGHLPVTLTRVEGAVDRLFRAMTFVNEVPLEAAVEGTSDFEAEFQQLGPFSAEGRSLRELDLGTRLVTNRLSYLVHTEAFRQLPPLALDLFAARLLDVLEGRTPSELTVTEREVILSILRDTEPDLLARVPGPRVPGR